MGRRREESLKTLLTSDTRSSCDVPISEGPVNLSWPAIMKTINEDTYAFYKDGGWEFVTGGGEVRHFRSSGPDLGADDVIRLRIRKSQSHQMGRCSTRARRMRNLARVQSQDRTVCRSSNASMSR